MRAWFYRFMNGRYGRDEFGIFLIIFSFLLLLPGLFAVTFVTLLLYYASIICIFFCLYRMLSKNIYKRRRENNTYIKIKNEIIGWFRQKIYRIKNIRTQRFFRCPGCNVTIRVPRGKGRIEIRCPRCGKTFIKKS